MSQDLNYNQVRDELKQLISQNENLNKSTIARSLGVSAASVSGFLNGTYKGDIDRMTEMVYGYLIRIKERRQFLSVNIPFIETSIAKKFFEVARICHLDNEIGVLVGQAGIGKTFACKEYSRRNMDAILIEADPSYSPKVLFDEIASRLNRDSKGNLHDLFETIIETLKSSDRLIIVDEAENLPYKALEFMRRLHDRAGIGVLLVGMPRLVENLRGKSADFKQLYSRVGIFADMPGIIDSDVEALVNSSIPEHLKNGNANIWQSFKKECRNNMRTLSKLVARTIRIADINKTHVDAEIVSAATKTLIV